MSTGKTNKRKYTTINTKVPIINAVDKQEKLNVQMRRDFEIVSITVLHHFKEKGKILNAISLSSEQYILLYFLLCE